MMTLKDFVDKIRASETCLKLVDLQSPDVDLELSAIHEQQTMDGQKVDIESNIKMKELLKKLIEQDSSNPPGNEKKVVEVKSCDIF